MSNSRRSQKLSFWILSFMILLFSYYSQWNSAMGCWLLYRNVDIRMGWVSPKFLSRFQNIVHSFIGRREKFSVCQETQMWLLKIRLARIRLIPVTSSRIVHVIRLRCMNFLAESFNQCPRASFHILRRCLRKLRTMLSKSYLQHCTSYWGLQFNASVKQIPTIN